MPVHRKGRGTPWKLLRGGRGRPRTLRAETRPAARQGTKRRSSKKPQVDNSETAWGAKKGHRRLKYLMTISVKTRSLIYFFDEPELILHVLEKSRRTFSYRNEKHSYQNGPWKSWVPVQHSGHAWSTSATRSSRFITTVLVCVHLL